MAWHTAKSHKSASHQRKVLKVLEEQGKAMFLDEIALWSGDAESTLSNDPPQTLVERGLMVKARFMGKFDPIERTVRESRYNSSL